MVHVTKGMLVTCDPVMKQLLLHLDETLSLGSKFVIADLDDNHLFVQADVYNQLREHIDVLYEKVYYNQNQSSGSSF